MKKLASCVFSLLIPMILLVALNLPTYALEIADPAYYDQLKGADASLNVYNWGEYISDGSDDSINVIREFENLTGIKVNYSTFATNEELYAKLRSGGANYDVIIPSDYMIGRMVHEDMLEKLDLNNIPNYAFIDEKYKNAVYDPNNEFSVPYTWGMVGMIYNTTVVDETEDVNTWELLWNEKYMGNILMFGNPRDAFGIALKREGYSLNPDSDETLRAATDALKDQKMLVQAYVMDEIFDKMISGEAAIAPYYAGDAITMISDNEDLAFAIPREGTNIFVDGVCIPKGAKNKQAAEMFINFLCEPEVGVANSEYIGYSTPNAESYKLLEKETRESPIGYPPSEDVERAEYFIELPLEINKSMDRMWTEVLSEDEQYSRWLIPITMLLAIIASISINVVRSYRKKKGTDY